MIVRPLADGWLVVRQADHARLAGEIVALLREPELVEHPRRARLLRAVAEHDNGWWEEDAAPRLDPATGGPVDFRSLPAAARAPVVERSVERYAAVDPYVAALVAGHHLRLARSFGAESQESRLEALGARRDDLLEAAGVGADEAARDDRWLRLGDELSLVAATLDPAMLGSPGWRVEVEAQRDAIELAVEPFPWTGTTTLRLPSRQLSRASRANAVALGVALASTPSAALRVRLAPL